MGRKMKASLWTMASNTGSSLLFIVCNMIYTNYMLKQYGSTVNGLISTLTQFISLFAVLEGGITTAATVAVYKPVILKDYVTLNNILTTARKYFRNISVCVLLLGLLTGTIYIKYIDTPYSYAETFLLLVISLFVMVVTLLTAKYNILLQGSNKGYLLYIFSTVVKLGTWGMSLYFIVKGFPVITVYAWNLVHVSANYLLLQFYIKRHYRHLDFKGKSDKK